MSFVDRCHEAGIGVILDFAPVHFATDYYALREFDGSCLYEYSDPAHTFSPWGSCQFDLGKDPVRSFLMIFDEIMNRGDQYFILADFQSYCEACERVEKLYLDKAAWAHDGNL